MKKLVFLFLTTIAFFACKNDTKKQTNGDAQLFRGEFIHTADAAVLKGEDFIYGVAFGPMTDELAKKVAPLKREEFDMVPVVIMGVIKANPEEEGWDEIIEITEIMGVSRPTGKLATKVKAASGSTEGTVSENEGQMYDDHAGHNH